MRLASTLVVAVSSTALFAGCSSSPSSTETPQQATARDAAFRREASQLQSSAEVTVARSKRSIPGIDVYFDSSAGYAVFPEITKGGLGIGAAHGKGVVYERAASGPDRAIGTTEMTQGTIGLQIGGQTFSEIIFFEGAAALERFKSGSMEVSAQASGVAAGEGATSAAKYSNGVAVFVFGEQGLMGEASVGGQGFRYWPLE